MGDHSRLVLLVDDEPMIRDLIRSALSGLDCTVVEAGSGTEAVELFKKHGTRIALLLADIVMPGMQGDELATLLMALHPELPVLFISDITKHLPPRLQHLECLAKPFDPEVLTRKVAEMLSCVEKRRRTLMVASNQELWNREGGDTLAQDVHRPTIGGRRSARTKARGMALLVFGETLQNRVAGVLVNAGDGGFCVSHPFPDFKKGDVVLFLHPLSEGAARVIWTLAVALDFETGFAYLSSSPSD